MDGGAGVGKLGPDYLGTDTSFEDRQHCQQIWRSIPREKVEVDGMFRICCRHRQFRPVTAKSKQPHCICPSE